MSTNGFETVELIPVNFRLSEKAAAMIRELTELASREMGRRMLVAILWQEEYDEIKRKVIVHGIATAGYYADEIPSRLVQQVDGASLLFFVTPRDALHFQAKTIDFQDQKFVLTP